MWAPYDPVSYFLHTGFGVMALAGAVTALLSRKGSRLHRRGGWVFVAPMLVAAATAVVFEMQSSFARPLAVVMAVSTAYLLATAVLAFRPAGRPAQLAMWILPVVPLVLAGFSLMVLGRGLASGAYVQVPGSALYALVFLLLFAGDLRLLRQPLRERAYWIKRHALRILLALAFAVRAVLSFAFDGVLPFPVIATAPLLLALVAAWLAFRFVDQRSRAL